MICYFENSYVILIKCVIIVIFTVKMAQKKQSSFTLKENPLLLHHLRPKFKLQKPSKDGGESQREGALYNSELPELPKYFLFCSSSM